MTIYKKLDLRSLYETHADRPRTLARLRKQRVEREIRHIRATLRKLHRANKATRLTAEERRIQRLFSDIPGSRKFLRAAAEDRVRSQTGIGEKFRQGIQISGRYLDEMEAIFRQAGLPVGLTRLPLVESTFNINAYSKAGAAGVWQFIRSTGRLFMRVDGLIDERRDPILAARAAAKLLKANYDRLGTWPLAITAYNHGQAGMARAVRKLGTTDIARIIRSYKSRRFGFASRNFYPEFLAALEVEKNATAYFGEIKRDAPFRYDEIALDGYLSLGVAARCANISTERLIEFNPALGRSIRRGRRFIPQRLPAASAGWHGRPFPPPVCGPGYQLAYRAARPDPGHHRPTLPDQRQGPARAEPYPECQFHPGRSAPAPAPVPGANRHRPGVGRPSSVPTPRHPNPTPSHRPIVPGHRSPPPRLSLKPPLRHRPSWPRRRSPQLRPTRLNPNPAVQTTPIRFSTVKPWVRSPSAIRPPLPPSRNSTALSG